MREKWKMNGLKRGVILLLILGNLVYAVNEKVQAFEKAVKDANLTYVQKHISDKDIVADLKEYDDAIERAVSNLSFFIESKKDHAKKEKITILLLEHGANFYYKGFSTSILEKAISANYYKLTEYLLDHGNIEKYYTLSNTNNFFSLVRSKKMMDLFIKRGLGDISYKDKFKETLLHLILRNGLLFDHGLDCKNLGELKQFLHSVSTLHRRPIDWYVSSVSTKEEQECFDDLVNQMHFEKKNDTLLIDMISKNFPISSYENLINRGINLNSGNYKGQTALDLAIIKNHKELIQLLLDKKAKLDINKKDNDGDSLLLNAIINKNVNLVKLLIDKGSDIGIVNKKGQTALFLAKEKKLTEIVKILEKTNAKILSLDKMQKMSYEKEYRYALRYKDIKAIKSLIDSDSVSINTTANDGRSPLSSFMRTSGTGNEELLVIINYLIDEGIDLNLGEDTAETLLAKAFEYNRIGIAKKLMKRGAKVEGDEVMSAFTYLEDEAFIIKLVKKNPKLLTGVNMFKKTLLTDLASKGKKNFKFFNKLLEHVDIHSENKDGTYNNLFRLVKEEGDKAEIKPFVESMLYHGYSSATRLHNGKSILMVALESGSDLEIVKLFTNNSNSLFSKILNKGKKTDLKVKSKDGRKIAHFMALAKSDVLEYMITLGVKVGLHGGKDDVTPLMLAVQKNRFKNIAFLLDKSTLNHEDKYGKTALNYAMEYDYSYMFKPLKDAGAIVNTKEHIEKKSALYALAKKELKGLEKILKSGDKKTFLEEYKKVKEEKLDDFIDDVLAYGNLNLFKSLLEEGISLNRVNKSGFSLLALAVFHDNMEVVKLLLKKKADINALSKEKRSVFLLSTNSSVKMLKFLLKEGIETEQDKEKIVNEALRYNNKEVASYLVKKGFPFDIKKVSDDDIAYYIRKGKAQSMDFLLSQGLDVNHKVYNGFHKKPLLIHAIVSWENEVAKLLISKGADIYALVEYDSGNLFKNPPTALNSAIQRNNKELVALLLEKGAKVDSLSKEDDIAPLLVALQNKHARIAQMLIEKGCDVNVLNEKNKMTALMYASYYGYFSTVQMLIEHGAKVDVKDVNGKTAYDIAKNNGYELIYEYLISKR